MTLGKARLLGLLSGAIMLMLLATSCTGADGRSSESPTGATSAVSPASPAGSPLTGSPPSGTPTSIPSAEPGTAPRAEPDPTRAKVSLSFTVADDLRSVAGNEKLSFTPDRRTCSVMLRTWSNVTTEGRDLSALTITRIRDVAGNILSHNSSQRNTRVDVKLGECVGAGSATSLDIDFRLTPTAGLDERTSRQGDVAWFGTAYPLLAWQRGAGWADDAPQVIPAESVSSEAFELTRLTISAASRWKVAGTGTPGATSTAGQQTVHTFSSPAVRDVSFVVGNLRQTTFEAGGTTVHLTLPARTRASQQTWQTSVTERMNALVGYLGPSPHPDVWVSVTPGISSGLEMPGAAFLGDLDLRRDRWLITHELAHLWFYDMVGNNQARHPWMDEAFASYVQQHLDPQAGGAPTPRRLRGRLGDPLTTWARDGGGDDYVAAVYVGGASLLQRLRQEAGPHRFDAALRDYLNTNAWTLATPEDVRTAFDGLPTVVSGLTDAGALR